MDRRTKFIKIYSYVTLGSIIISFVLVMAMKIHIHSTAIKMNTNVITASDFTMMGYNMTFERHDPEFIEKELRKYFKELGIVDI